MAVTVTLKILVAMAIGTLGLLLLSFVVWRIPTWTTLERVLLCLAALVYVNFLHVLDSLTLLMWS